MWCGLRPRGLQQSLAWHILHGCLDVWNMPYLGHISRVLSVVFTCRACRYFCRLPSLMWRLGGEKGALLPNSVVILRILPQSDRNCIY